MVNLLLFFYATLSTISTVSAHHLFIITKKDKWINYLWLRKAKQCDTFGSFPQAC